MTGRNSPVRIWWLAWLVASCGWFTALAVGQSPLTLRLVSAEAGAYADVVRVADVAEIESADPRLRDRIAQLDLDAFDETGRPLTITARQIAYRLRLARFSEDEFEIVGAPVVTVYRRQKTDERPLLERLLHSQLVAEFHLQPGDIQVQIDGPSAGLLARHRLEPESLQLRAKFPPEIPLGTQTLDVQLWDRTGRQATAKVPVNIAVIRDLAMARANISRGEVLTSDRIERVRRPVTSHAVQYASFEQVVGHVARSPIQQFSLLPANAVGDAPQARNPVVVKRLDRVRVELRSGRLVVQLRKAQAMQNGRVGDRIEVMNIDTRKSFVGRVVGPGHVVVDP